MLHSFTYAASMSPAPPSVPSPDTPKLRVGAQSHPFKLSNAGMPASPPANPQVTALALAQAPQPPRCCWTGKTNTAMHVQMGRNQEQDKTIRDLSETNEVLHIY
jgi:hypothetical protein